MKKCLKFIVVFVLITLLIMSYVKANLDLNLVEVHLGNPQSPEKVNNLIESMYAYDFVNVYDVLINNKKSKVCHGNINILLEQYKFKNLKLNYTNNEVLVGKKYIQDKFLYSIPPKTLTTCSNSYNINGVLLDTEDVIYEDINLLKNSVITNQTLYIEKSSLNGYIDTDRINTVLNYRYANVKKIYDYNNLFKALTIILFFLLSIIVIICMYTTIKLLKKTIKLYKENYEAQKRTVYFHNYFKQKTSLIKLLRIIAYVISTIFLIICLVFFVRYMFITKLTINKNITSIKNIINLVYMLKEFLRFNFKNGFSYYEVMLFKVISAYSIMCLITVINIIKSTCMRIYKSVIIK